MKGNNITADKDYYNINSPYYSEKKEQCNDCSQLFDTDKLNECLDGKFRCEKCFENHNWYECTGNCNKMIKGIICNFLGIQENIKIITDEHEKNSK